METLQRSFTAGEISPALGARADLNKYQTGLSTLRNAIVQAEGGISNRTGFEFVGYTPNNIANARLIPFQFNTEQTYILVFVEGKFMVVSNGGYVTEAAQSIDSITLVGNLITKTAHGYVDGDMVTFTGISGETDPVNGVTPVAGAKYELNFEVFEVDNATANSFTLNFVDSGNPVNLSLYGGANPSVAGADMRRLYSAPHPYLTAQLPDVRYTQSADIMTIVHPSHPPAEISRIANDDWSHDDISFDSTVAVPSINTIVASGTTTSTDQKVYRYAITAVNANGQESDLSTPAITATQIVLDVARKNTITITASVGAVTYNIYKAESESSDFFGYIGSTKTTTFEDYNIAPDTTDAPAEDARDTLFTGADNYPSSVAYYQQRIIYGGTNNKPETIETSRISDYKSLRTSVPTKADDSISFTIADTQVNRVRHILSVGSLLVLTSGGEWKITDGEDQVLTPTTVSARLQSKYGSVNIAPIVVDQSALYIQESGSRLRDIGYTFESDSYAGTDLSIMAQHLFDGFQITDMTFCQEPDRLVWLIRDDGKLLGLTYHKEHKITGWSQHDTDGLFKTCSSVQEGNENILYVCCQRTVNGNTVNTIERHREANWTNSIDGFFLDQGRQVTYDEPTALVFHAYHLVGELVTALIDGKVYRDLEVSDRGIIELPELATTITYGRSYTTDVNTLDIDSAQRMIKGKVKNIGEVVFQFYRWRGGFIGANEEGLREIKPRQQSDNYDPIAIKNQEVRVAVDSVWTDGGKVLFRQVDPLPVTILAIAPEMSVG